MCGGRRAEELLLDVRIAPERPGQRGEHLQVSFPLAAGGSEKDHAVDREIVGGLEVEPLTAETHHADHREPLGQLPVGNGEPSPETGRDLRLAFQDRAEKRVPIDGEVVGADEQIGELNDRLVLRPRPQSRDDVLLLEEVDQAGTAPTHLPRAPERDPGEHRPHDLAGRDRGQDGGGVGVPLSRMQAILTYERACGADTTSMGHSDYSFKPVKSIINFEMNEYYTASQMTTAPFFYGAQPNMGLYYQPDGPCVNPAELLGKGDIEGILKELHAQGFKGAFGIEYEPYKPENFELIARCIEYFESVAAKLAAS